MEIEFLAREVGRVGVEVGVIGGRLEFDFAVHGFFSGVGCVGIVVVVWLSLRMWLRMKNHLETIEINACDSCLRRVCIYA